MFLRAKRRFKDGKEHRYWSIVETQRTAGNRVVQRQVLYLGEINDSQRSAWAKSIEVVQDDGACSRQMALFPSDRPAPLHECDTVQVNLSALSLHHPRQWGACWLALNLWEQLQLDAFWADKLRPQSQRHALVECVQTPGLLSADLPRE